MVNFGSFFHSLLVWFAGDLIYSRAGVGKLQPVDLPPVFKMKSYYTIATSFIDVLPIADFTE